MALKDGTCELCEHVYGLPRGVCDCAEGARCRRCQSADCECTEADGYDYGMGVCVACRSDPCDCPPADGYGQCYDCHLPGGEHLAGCPRAWREAHDEDAMMEAHYGTSLAPRYADDYEREYESPIVMRPEDDDIPF